MAELGHFALLLSLFLACYAVLVDLLGAWRQDTGLIKSGCNATIGCLVCLTVAMISLGILLVKGDFGVNYVAEHTSRALPIAYRISALWAGAAGSLLLWLWLQVGFVVIVFCKYTVNPQNFRAGARATANFVCAFFLVVLIFDKNPFVLSVVAAADGMGLNPLLQHPAMVLHPPTLFIGYAGFAIPFAWAFATLKTDGGVDRSLLFKQVRNWILFSWLFLTIGIVLGAWWAYEELGWGGYWAWDPVENSSLMPWLTATALLHCCRTYKQNTSIATWMIILSLLTYSMCVFGTFLTRYGLVSSVHAFPEPGLGILFLVLLGLIWIIAAVLLWFAYRDGKIGRDVAGWAGHKFIAFNNWLMVLLMGVIFVGTLFPFLSGLLTEKQISLKPDYFTKVTAPGGLLLILLLGVCPYLLRNGFKRSWQVICGVVVAIVAAVTWFVTGKLAVACFVICGFAGFNLVVDFVGRYIKRQPKGENVAVSKPSLRWYGARIVHIGVVLVFVGMAGSGGYDIEEQVALKTNDRVTVAGFELSFDGLRADHGSNFTAVTADISVYREGELIDKLSPSQAYYSESDKRTSEVDIRRTLAYDLYVALTEVDRSNQLINLRILVKPLINWIWIGSTISVVGTVLVLVSFYRKKTAVLQNQD